MSSESKEPPLTVRRLHSSAEPEFDALLRIYTEAHPASQRKSSAVLRRMIESPEYFFLIMTAGASVVAFSISMCFRNSDAALLEYVAVAAGNRNRGLGRLLFRHTAEFDAITQRYLLIEVDSDNPASSDHEDMLRRKNFYRRLGCRKIEGLSYIMPSVSSEMPPPMVMFIYSQDLPASVARSRLRSWLQNCYSQVYQVPADDRRIDLMLEHLPHEVRLI